MPYNKEMLCIINLLAGSLAEEGRDYFKYLVQKHNGKLHVLTHAHYHEEDQENAFYTRAEGYVKRRDTFINACLKNNVPLVVFEQFKDLDKLPQRIQAGGTLFRVATEDGAGWLFNHRKQWPVLMQIFKDAGVRHIISGGQNLCLNTMPDTTSVNDPDYRRYLEEFDLIRQTTTHTRAWLERKLNPSECAGGITKLLARAGFEVTLSPISSPDNYWDIIKREYNQKKEIVLL